jgi:hypothetical protein
LQAEYSPPDQAFHLQIRHFTTRSGISPPDQAFHLQVRHFTSRSGISPPDQALSKRRIFITPSPPTMTAKAPFRYILPPPECTPCAFLVYSLCLYCALLVPFLCTPCASLVYSLCLYCVLLVPFCCSRPPGAVQQDSGPLVRKAEFGCQRKHRPIPYLHV